MKRCFALAMLILALLTLSTAAFAEDIKVLVPFDDYMENVLRLNIEDSDKENVSAVWQKVVDVAYAIEHGEDLTAESWLLANQVSRVFGLGIADWIFKNQGNEYPIHGKQNTLVSGKAYFFAVKGESLLEVIVSREDGKEVLIPYNLDFCLCCLEEQSLFMPQNEQLTRQEIVLDDEGKIALRKIVEDDENN